MSLVLGLIIGLIRGVLEPFRRVWGHSGLSRRFWGNWGYFGTISEGLGALWHMIAISGPFWVDLFSLFWVGSFWGYFRGFGAILESLGPFWSN